MKIAQWTASLSIFLSLAFVSSTALANNKCAKLFEEQPFSRTEVLDYLVKNDMTAVRKSTGKKDIPVILMNSDNAQKLQGLIENSIGTTVAHQPGYNNDHGLLRLGNIIMDLDSPGYRQRGEIHATGLSWVNVYNYLSYKSSSKRIEVLYALTKEERKVAYAYAAMRRAAIIRVPFTFGGATQDRTLPNMLNNAGEHCFIYCSGSGIRSQIYEIKSKVQQTGLGTLESLQAKEDVQKWLSKVTEAILNADPADAYQLGPDITTKVFLPATISKNPVFMAMNEPAKREAVNWIVGGHISEKYDHLITELGFYNTGNGFNGMYNERATAVLVYDSRATADTFMDTNYESPGIFSTWTHRDAKSIYRD